MKEIKLESSKNLEFEYQGQKVSVRSREIGQFLVLSHLRGEQPSMPEIGDNECRPIGVHIPKNELYMAVASTIAEQHMWEIQSFQFLEDEDKAIFLVR